MRQPKNRIPIFAKNRNSRNRRIDASIWEAAWQLFERYDDKTWSCTDCTRFVIMRQMEILQAFAFDSHFEQAGFQLWPGMNP